MSILTIKNMSHSFGDRVIFKDASFRFLKGEHVGLVGSNGEGKSTFMNIITNELIIDDGTVEWSSKVKVGYMNQNIDFQNENTIRSVLREGFSELYDIEKKIEDLYKSIESLKEEDMIKAINKGTRLQEILDNNEFHLIDSKIDAVAGGLGLKAVGLDKKVKYLSGGQKTKVLLGKLLLETPDILLLDEPTNYLDENHIRWLKEYLKSYKQGFILISHDTEFLNSVVNVIWHIENKNLTRYIGNYDKFIKDYEIKKDLIKGEYERQQEEIRKLEDFVKKNKARAATKGLASARQKRLDKIQRIEISGKKPKPHFNFKISRPSGKTIFETQDLVIGYGDPLSKSLNLTMERGQKIALIGANGIGKSTLLKSLLGLIKPLSGEVVLGEYQDIGYFQQEDREISNKSVMEEMWDEFKEYNRYDIRSILAKCGLTKEHIDSSVDRLSGGEQAKVRLCKLINKPTNILILDEPTNHLDVEAKEELKKSLKEYEGSILLVCHEAEFYRDIVTHIWDCERWESILL